MARVPRVLPSSSRSDFSQAQIPRVNGWTALAEVMGVVNETIKPALRQKFQETGANSVYRDETGSLRVDEMNLLSGEMAAAHNAAAYSSYLAKSGIDARESVAELAQRFELDPQGFAEAAQVYKSKAMESAPRILAADVEDTISREILATTNGLAMKRIKQDRSEANRSTALRRDMLAEDAAGIIDRYGPESPEAQRAIEEALMIERVRVGHGFSVEEDIEVLGREILAKGEAKRLSRLKVQSKQVIEAARAGLTHELEAETLRDSVGTDLENPLRVATAGRDVNPEFSRLPPEAQAAFIAEFESLPATEGSADIVAHLREVHKDTKVALAKDPIGLAKDRNPSMVQPVSLGDPNSLTLRLQSAGALSELGLNPSGRLFDDAESKALRAEMATMGPADVLTAVGNLVAGMDERGAVAAISEIGGKPTTVHAAQLIAVGADPDIALNILVGQAVEKAVPIKNDIRAAAEQTFLAELRLALPEQIVANMTPQLLAAAGAYYQGMGLPGGIEEGDQEIAYAEALSASLGGMNGRGGVQEVNGKPTLLPPLIGSQDAQSAFDAAFGLIGADVNLARREAKDLGKPLGEVLERFAGAGREQFNSLMSRVSVDGQGVPMIGDQPIDPGNTGALHLVAVGHDTYQLRMTLDDADVALINSATGQAYEMSLTSLVELTR